MRLLPFLTLLLVAPVAAQVDQLDRLVGRWLHQDPAAQAVVRSIIGGTAGGLGPVPWHVWRRPKGGYFVLEARRLIMIPGASGAQVHQLDARGKSVDTWNFDVAYRGDIASASFGRVTQLGELAIMIRTETVLGGGLANTQYYCLCDGGLALVWMTGPGGKPVQNRYYAPNFTVGPELMAQDTAGWRKLIESKRVADQLAGLMFLGGDHSPPGGLERDVFQEDIPQTFRVHRARLDPKVRARVAALAGGDHPWVKAAARSVQSETRRMEGELARRADSITTWTQRLLPQTLQILRQVQGGQFDAVHESAAPALRKAIDREALSAYFRRVEKECGKLGDPPAKAGGISLGWRDRGRTKVRGLHLGLTFGGKRRDASVSFAVDGNTYRLIDFWVADTGWSLNRERKR